MAFSTQRAVSDGTMSYLDLTINYISRDDIQVFYDGLPADPDTWDWVGTTETRISFTPNVPNGVEVLIARTTRINSIINVFALGAKFNNTTMDENFTQLLYLNQEAVEGAALTDIFNDVDMHGKHMKNLGLAVDRNDAITYGQVQDMVPGVVTSANAAAASAAAAAVSATAASGSATSAASSATAASTSASSAGVSAASATSSATAASNYATNASDSASFASTAAGNAAASAGAAATSAASAASSYDSFDDRYLGSKAADPSVDNDGGTLLDGALYWNNSGVMKVWYAAGSAWQMLSGFVQNAIGAVTRTMLSKAQESVSLFDFMSAAQISDVQSRTGSLDLTSVIQAALTATRSNGNPFNRGKRLLWPAGVYKVTAQLILGSEQYIHFEPGVVVNLASGVNVDTTSLFVASNQTNITLIGNGAVLNGTRVGAVAEGNATGISVYGCDNYRIQDFNINDFATDGITISGDDTGSGPCTNGVVENVVANNNRRQGMSIISAKGLRVIGGMYSGTNGAPSGPWAGIDIEPNADCYMEGVVLIGVNTSNNAGAGIQVTPDLLATTGRRFDVTIIGGKSVNDGATSTIPGLRFVGTAAPGAQQHGQVVVRDFVIDSPKGRGVGVVNWDSDLSPQIIMDNVGVINPDATGVAGTNYDRTGFVIYNETGSAVTNLGNVIMRDCWARDTRGSPRMVWGMVLDVQTSKVLKNIRIDNPKSTNFTAGSKMDVSTRGTAVTGAMLNVSVNYIRADVMTLAGSSGIGDFGGKRVRATASLTATLPSAANCEGMSYELEVASGITSVTLAPATGDTIEWYPGVINTGVVLDEGGTIRVVSLGGTKWRVEFISGQYRRAGTSQARRIIHVTAIPSSGTWVAGDIAINISATTGQPSMWECTTGGTPGTWQPLAPVGQVQAAHVATTSGATLAALETNVNDLITKLITAKVVA